MISGCKFLTERSSKDFTCEYLAKYSKYSWNQKFTYSEKKDTDPLFSFSEDKSDQTSLVSGHLELLELFIFDKW